MHFDDLKALVNEGKYAQLLTIATQRWEESADLNMLPLISASHHFLERSAKAKTYFDQALEHKTQLSVDAMLVLAQVAGALNQPDCAQSLLATSTSEHPNHSEAQYVYGHWLMSRGDQTRAVRHLQVASCLQPENFDYLAAWIQTLLLDRHFEIAAPMLAKLSALAHQASAQSEKHNTLNELQLRCWIGAGDLSQAEQWLSGFEQQFEDSQNLGDHKISISNLLGAVQVSARLLSEYYHFDSAEELLASFIERYRQREASLRLKLELAELAQRRGRDQQALAILRGIVQDHPYNLSARLRIGQLLERIDPAAALVVVNKLEETLTNASDPDNDTSAHYTDQEIRHYLQQAQILAANAHDNLGEFKQASELYERILEETPYDLKALQGLGQQKLQHGDIQGATELFNRIEKINPIGGFSALASAKQYPSEPSALDAIEAKLALPAMPPESKASIQFNLAAAWEKQGDYDKAFKLVQAANDGFKPFLSYDPKAHRNECARIRTRFTRAFFDHRGHYGSDSELPVFIVGMPRSGTTLVEQILASHSQIFGAGELGVIPQRIQGMNRWERHTGSGRQYPDSADDLSPTVLQGIADGIIQELRAYSSSATYVLDKLPHNFKHIGLIKLLFPNARIISVRRDPRDIAISNYFTDFAARHGGMGYAYDLRHIGEQLADHNLLMHHWHQVFPEEILEVKYEDLIENPKHEIERLLEYLSVDWEEDVLNFSSLDRAVKTASVWQVRQPIYHSSKQRWQRYQRHLGALIEGTNAKITWDPITDMISLPEPGLIHKANELFEAGALGDAEYEFKKILHHNPNHATANGMIGVIFARANLLSEALPYMERAHQLQPWVAHWADNLKRAYQALGQLDKLAELEQQKEPAS